ncbi:MAG: pyroglutamyl-peptidase I, partial [Lysobacteraceae bacterium]
MPRKSSPSSSRSKASPASAKPRAPVVLLTGFEPFGGERRNPSWEAVRRLRGARIAGHRVVVARLPVAFADSLPVLRRALREYRPALTICIGQAGGRARISLERVALNLIDARIPDNTGAQPVDKPVVVDGPAAYFGSLPVKAMLVALDAAGFSAELSHSAGTYVCNQVFYGLMHALR